MQKILSLLNFTDEEIKTYLLLLEVGPITAGELAKKLGIPRSSLYGFLKRLQNKGLIKESMKWGVKTFYTEEPEKIGILFQQKIDALQEGQERYKESLPELKKQKPLTSLPPKFQLYEGKEGVAHILKDMLLYDDIETLAVWPIKDMIDTLSAQFLRYHNKVRIKNNVSIRAIWPQDKIVDVKKHPYLGVGEAFKREVRVAPKAVSFSMGYWMYGDKVAFVSSLRESFGFIIESRELIELLTSQFEILWKLSKPITIDSRHTKVFLQEMERYF